MRFGKNTAISGKYIISINTTAIKKQYDIKAFIALRIRGREA